jgi:hypothetical protein
VETLPVLPLFHFNRQMCYGATAPLHNTSVD